MWDATFTIDYGGLTLSQVLTIVAATPTPGTPIPTYTPTAVATPAGAALKINSVGPAGLSTVNVNSSLTLSYTINNTTGSASSVRLVARLLPSGMNGYGALDDLANQPTISAPAGINNFTRTFVVPATAGQGGYDIVYSLVNPSNGTVLDTLTVRNIVWVNIPAPASTTGNMSLTSGALSANSITLQSGVMNRITGTFTINSTAAAATKVILRMRIKLHNTTTFVTDLAGDALVSVPPGNSVWNRGFPVPLYLASGSYDVVWELGDASFTGTVDSAGPSNILTITNAAPLANKGIPILMYHSINPSPLGNNYVLTSNFTQQMQYLVDNGWTTITGDDFYNYTYKGTALPTKPVWLTFDDSYQNIYDYALPIMQSRGLKGSIFAVTEYMGQMNSWDLNLEPQHLHMTWNMMQALRDANFAMDSHTLHHVHLQEIPVAQQLQETWESQRDLASFLGAPSATFSYPYGQYPASAEWFIAHSGFRNATTINTGKQYTNFATMFELSRIGVSSTDDITAFANKLNNP